MKMKPDFKKWLKKELKEVWNVPDEEFVIINQFAEDYAQEKAEPLLKAFEDHKNRCNQIQMAGSPHKIQENPQIFLQIAGITLKNAKLLTKKCTAIGAIPEALRIAHFIGASRYQFLTSN